MSLNSMRSETKRPFLLSRHTAIVVHILERNSDETDMFVLSEADNFDESNYERHGQAAKDYIDALDDHYSYRFLECLRDEVQARMDEWKKNRSAKESK